MTAPTWRGFDATDDEVFTALLCQVMEKELVPLLSSLSNGAIPLPPPGRVSCFVHGSTEDLDVDPDYTTSAACFLETFGADLDGYFDRASAWRDVVRLYGVVLSMLDKLDERDEDTQPLCQRLAVVLQRVQHAADELARDMGLAGLRLPVLMYVEGEQVEESSTFIHEAISRFCDHVLEHRVMAGAPEESRQAHMHCVLSATASPVAHERFTFFLRGLRQADMGHGLLEAFLYLSMF
jgi:hypothetical protein